MGTEQLFTRHGIEHRELGEGGVQAGPAGTMNRRSHRDQAPIGREYGPGPERRVRAADRDRGQDHSVPVVAGHAAVAGVIVLRARDVDRGEAVAPPEEADPHTELDREGDGHGRILPEVNDVISRVDEGQQMASVSVWPEARSWPCGGKVEPGRRLHRAVEDHKQP